MVKAEQGLDSPALGDSFGPAGFQSTTSSMSSLPTIHLDSKNSTKEDLLPMPMFHTSMPSLPQIGGMSPASAGTDGASGMAASAGLALDRAPSVDLQTPPTTETPPEEETVVRQLAAEWGPATTDAGKGEWFPVGALTTVEGDGSASGRDLRLRELYEGMVVRVGGVRRLRSAIETHTIDGQPAFAWKEEDSKWAGVGGVVLEVDPGGVVRVDTETSLSSSTRDQWLRLPGGEEFSPHEQQVQDEERAAIARREEEVRLRVAESQQLHLRLQRKAARHQAEQQIRQQRKQQQQALRQQEQQRLATGLLHALQQQVSGEPSPLRPQQPEPEPEPEPMQPKLRQAEPAPEPEPEPVPYGAPGGGHLDAGLLQDLDRLVEQASIPMVLPPVSPSRFNKTMPLLTVDEVPSRPPRPPFALSSVLLIALLSNGSRTGNDQNYQTPRQDPPLRKAVSAEKRHGRKVAAHDAGVCRPMKPALTTTTRAKAPARGPASPALANS